MTNRMDSAAALTPRRRKSQLHWQLLLMVLPALIYLLIFHYKPMYGVVIAFKNYKFKLGILGSPWCGLENFQRLFSSYWFPIILKNTLTISIETVWSVPGIVRQMGRKEINLFPGYVI